MLVGTALDTGASESHGSAIDSNTTHGGHVALVCMPWGSIETPSIAIGLLKRYVRASGFTPDLHYLNVRFAERIGLELYEQIARAGFLHTEWFFSQALFGPGGSGELANGWAQISTDPGAQSSLVQNFKEVVGLSEAQCERLATIDVPEFLDDCFAAVDWSKYLVVGFTTTFAQSLSTLSLARRIKHAHPHVQIVLGGANVDSEMGVELMRAFDWIDFVVHGEAEYTFPVLLRNIAAGRPDDRVPGVSHRIGGEVLRNDLAPPPLTRMNDVPTPDYSDYIAEMDRTGFKKTLPITLWYESSRGCWWGAKHHCTFCGLNHNGMTYRKKDAARVYADIVDMANSYRCLRLAATDNIMANEYFTELLPKLAALDADLQLFYEVKANLRRDQIKLMSQAGIRSIQPGVESFNSRVLQLMRKGVTAIQNVQLLKWCHEFDIRANYNVLYAFPGETPDDYAGLDVMFRKLGHLRPPGEVLRVVVERFSPYFFEKEKWQLEYTPWRAYDYIYPAPRVDIPKIAYFFHGTWPNRVGNPEEYIAPAKAALKEWQAESAKETIRCTYEKGPGYVRVYDNRPRASGAEPRGRGFDLNEKLSALFLFCDENHTFNAILTMMQEKFGDEASEAKVRKWLDELVNQWLMMREGDRYLTLPVRRRAASTRS
jgi:ribosomal peptide maturation radical SAM protein 1